jgi:AhpD family alkylhydroperoxidase
MTQRLDYQKLSVAGVRAVSGVYMYVMNSGLPKTLLDLVFLRASQINGCAYCIDMHSRELLKAEVPVEKLVLVPAWDEAGSLTVTHIFLLWAKDLISLADLAAPGAG